MKETTEMSKRELFDAIIELREGGEFPYLLEEYRLALQSILAQECAEDTNPDGYELYLDWIELTQQEQVGRYLAGFADQISARNAKYFTSVAV